MKTAVIYARFSCNKQREASIVDQLRVCRQWCADNGYAVVGEYCDEAKSGRTDDRPEFQRMIANAGESDIVLVYMMDRFSRDIYDAPIYKKTLRDHGARVVSATESLPDGPESMLMENMYEAMAAMESAKIGLRTKRGMEGNALNCLYNGDRVYGYSVDPDTHRYIIDESQANVVRECFSRRSQGESENSIAQAMAMRGVRTYRGRPCSHTMVHNMIRNVRYKGVYKWGDVEVDGGMPAIVTQEEWEMAQNIKASKVRKNEEWDDYLLSGKSVCGGCGWNAVGTSGRSRNGSKYCYYKCQRDCGEVKPVPKAWLEGRVGEELRKLVSDRELALEIGRIAYKYSKSSKVQEDKERAQKAVSDAERGLGNIMDAIEKGIVMPGIQERIDELSASKARAEAFLEGLREYDFSPEDFADFLQQASTLDDQKLIDMLVWQVQITNEEIIVVLNYDVEPEIPKRIEFEGFSSNSKWGEEGIKKPEHTRSECVRTNSVWLPSSKNTRTSFTVYSHRIAVVLKRPA